VIQKSETPMDLNLKQKIVTRTLSIIAGLFGLVTIFSGFRVLFELTDPGYVVFLPILIFNTLMGIIYLLAGWFIWTELERGFMLTKLIAFINLGVLIVIGILFSLADQLVAIDSIYAMSFRTFVWFGIYFIIKLFRR
jgi:hypothetical protein